MRGEPGKILARKKHGQPGAAAVVSKLDRILGKGGVIIVIAAGAGKLGGRDGDEVPLNDFRRLLRDYGFTKEDVEWLTPGN